MTTQSEQQQLDLLLGKLLSPFHEKELETVYQRIPPNEKIVGLISILRSHGCCEHEAAKCWLAATLLRRAICQLTPNSEVTDDTLISSVDSLLQGFHLLGGHTKNASPIRKMIAHCIAEICLVLSIRNNNRCVMTSVIQNIHNSIQSLLLQDSNATTSIDAVTSCMELLALLPARAPVAFCQQQQQPPPHDNKDLVHSILLSVAPLVSNSSGNIRLMHACMETLCNMASALSIIAQYNYDNNNATITEAQISLQLQLTADAASSPEKFKVIPPQVIYLAERVFLPLLEMLQTQLNASLLLPDAEDAFAIVAIVQLWLDTLPKAPQLFSSSQRIQKYVVEIIMAILRKQKQQLQSVIIPCLETICTLCQYCTSKDLLLSNYAASVLDMLMQLMIDGVDSDFQAWSEEESSSGEPWEGDEDYLQDVEMIFVNFVSLSRNLFMASVIQKIQNVGSSDWRCLRASLIILELLIDCSPKSFEPYVGDTIQFTLKNISNTSNPRIHYQACQLLGSIAAFNGAMISEQYTLDIVTALSRLLQSPCGKVISNACLAIISLLQALPPEGKVALIKLLPEFWRSIQQGVFGVGGHRNCNIIPGIHLIACLADTMEENFTAPYYKSSMTLLTSCIQSGLTTPEQRGAALEAMTIVCKAAAAAACDNSNVFLLDAKNIMTMILPLLEAYAAANSEQKILIPLEQTLTSSARLASLLEEEFTEFAPAVLPFLLQWATQELDVSVTDADERESETAGTESSVIISLPGIVGVQRISLNTTQIQLKSQAARSVYEIASAMGVSFGPYTEPCLSSFLPLVGFKYSMEVRSTSCQALAAIFSSACENAISGEARARSLPQQVFAPLVKSILKEIIVAKAEFDMDDIEEDLVAMADALSEIFFAAYDHKAEKRWCIAVLGPNDVDEVVATILSLLQDAFEERQRCCAKADQDENLQLENHLSKTAQLITTLVDCIGYTLKSGGEKFVKTFEEQIVPFFGPKLTAATGGGDKVAQHAAICLFDDCVEHCGPGAAATYGKMLVPGIVEVLTSRAADWDDLIAAAVYGTSQLAKHAPANLLESLVSSIIPCLVGISTACVEPDNALAEGAISALAALVLFPSAPFKNFNTSVDPASILEIFLNAMPLRADETEAQFCQEGLCKMLEKGDIDITCHAPTLLRIIAQTFCAVSNGEEVAPEAVLGMYSKVLVQMSSNVDSKILSNAFAALDPAEQQALQEASSRGY